MPRTIVTDLLRHHYAFSLASRPITDAAVGSDAHHG
jgi:hypothetical protein